MEQLQEASDLFMFSAVQQRCNSEAVQFFTCVSSAAVFSLGPGRSRAHFHPHFYASTPRNQCRFSADIDLRLSAAKVKLSQLEIRTAELMGHKKRIARTDWENA